MNHQEEAFHLERLFELVAQNQNYKIWMTDRMAEELIPRQRNRTRHL
jgi:hypothetical protein